jgi:hypothetical protein
MGSTGPCGPCTVRSTSFSLLWGGALLNPSLISPSPP